MMGTVLGQSTACSWTTLCSPEFVDGLKFSMCFIGMLLLELNSMCCPLALTLGTGEPVRAQYMCAIGTTRDDCHTWHMHV